MIRATAARLRRVIDDWRNGRRFGYPLCCVAMYCWDSLWNVPPALTRCCSQGIQQPAAATAFVVCGLLHDGGTGLPLRVRLGRIVRFWSATLAPRSPLWRRRASDPQAPRPPWVPLPPGPVSETLAFSRQRPGPLESAFTELDRW